MKVSCEDNRPVMVFVYDGGTFKSYSCCISSKKVDGSYVKQYVPLLFPDGSRPKDRDMINIKDSFVIVLGDNEKSRLGFYVRDFEVVANEETKK